MRDMFGVFALLLALGCACSLGMAEEDRADTKAAYVAQYRSRAQAIGDYIRHFSYRAPINIYIGTDCQPINPEEFTREYWTNREPVYVWLDKQIVATHKVEYVRTPFTAKFTMYGNGVIPDPAAQAPTQAQPVAPPTAVSTPGDPTPFSMGYLDGGYRYTLMVVSYDTTATPVKRTVHYSYPVDVENESRYSLGVGVVGSSMGQTKFVKRPNPNSTDNSTVLIASRKSGTQFDAPFTLSLYPFTPRVVNRPARNFGEAVSLVVGTAINKPLSTYLAGVGYEPAEGTSVIAGMMWKDVDELAPGYSIDSAIPSTLDIPTVSRKRSGFFLGVTFSTELWSRLWK